MKTKTKTTVLGIIGLLSLTLLAVAVFVPRNGFWSELFQSHSEHDDHAGHDHEGHDHDEHADHADADHDEHDEHAGHDEHEDDGIIRLDPDTISEFGIVVESASLGKLEQTLRLPGEVVFNADRMARVTPTVAGIVQSVDLSVGDRVEAGQVMAVLSSRELAESRSEVVAAKARLTLANDNLAAMERLYASQIELAEATLARDERLLQDKVGTERQVLIAKQALSQIRVELEIDTLQARQAITQARIALNQARSVLYALGYNAEQVDTIDKLDATHFDDYELVSPLSGVITQRHLNLGDVVVLADAHGPFVVADLSSVWVNLTVYQRDLASIRPGQRVTLVSGEGEPTATGSIAFISPAVDEHTRTATARIVIDNPDGHWRPGQFVTGEVTVDHAEVQAPVIPHSALQTVGEDTVVFISNSEGFEPRVVQVGRSNRTHVEIVSGLTVGEKFVARNAFALKSELNRASLEHAGHAH